MAKSREVFLQKVLPELLREHPDGIVPRSEIQGSCAGHNIPMQYWSIERDNRTGIGMFDLSDLTKECMDIPEEEPVIELTDAEIEKVITDRFKALDRYTEGVVAGEFRSILCSGNPGIGKTYTLEAILERAAEDKKITFQRVSGYVRATGIFRLLWENKEHNQVILFDDADSIFQDEVSLNLLKASCDSTRRRWVSWRSEKDFEDPTGEEIPKEFEFKGHVVFITNLDFDRMIRSNARNAPHFAALVSRAFYLDLNLNTTRELLVRIRSVIKNSDMLCDYSGDAKKDIISYMENNSSKLREVSLRMVLKLAQIHKASKSTAEFEIMASASCTRR